MNKILTNTAAQSKLEVEPSPSKKISVIYFIESPLKMMKNAFYFILKALFILKILWLFCLVEKNGLIRKIRLVSNPWRHNQVNKQLQYTHCPISHEVKATRHKTWSINVTRKIFFFKIMQKMRQEASSRRFFIFKICLIWGKSKWSASSFQYILIALNLGYNKNKLYETLDYWSRDMLNFNFP